MKPNSQGNECMCPEGKKVKPGGGGCEEDVERNRKGQCPDGQVLDPKEGQKPDTPNPKCQIDDEKDCKKPKIPATRPEGKENDSSYIVDCGQPEEESQRPKCNARTHYAFTWVDTDGKAHEECKKTNQFKERKKNKVSKLRSKLKDKWNKQKPQREEQEKARQAKLNELKDHQAKLQKEMEEREKLKEQNDKKKSRMGKCSTVTALMIGVAQNTAQKRDEEHPYDWTSDYFDEDFMTSDDRLKDWPSDIDIDSVACVTDNCVDADAWMKQWEEVVSAHDLQNWPSCTNGKRGLNSRCHKRSLSYIEEPEEHHTTNNHTVSFLARDKSLSQPAVDDFRQMELEERNPVLIVEILIEISLFGARLGISLLARTAANIARWAPRLANIAKNTGRLFKIAPKGQGGAKGVDGMKNAFEKIVQNRFFKKCLQDGVP
ncbi:hypothetical protein N0V90_000135 [Kalmusia sp. IMI 367209]|nr:hypothetical protein N0V90_000135 [Kalmusia sp. IMI 367209]